VILGAERERKTDGVPDIAQYLNFLNCIFGDCKYMACPAIFYELSRNKRMCFLKKKNKSIAVEKTVIRPMYQEVKLLKSFQKICH